jgi:hypothetical protein
MRCPVSGRITQFWPIERRRPEPCQRQRNVFGYRLIQPRVYMVGGIHMHIIIFSDIDPITTFWFGLIFFALLGLIPATIAYRRCLTDNYFGGEPHFTLADFVGWWVIGMAFFPLAMALSITNPFGTGSVAPRR